MRACACVRLRVRVRVRVRVRAFVHMYRQCSDVVGGIVSIFKYDLQYR